jgi:sarcosine oxidase subunit delta
MRANLATAARPTLFDRPILMPWADYVFMRSNTRGLHREQWVHAHGCRRWFKAERDTVSYDIVATWPMNEERP